MIASDVSIRETREITLFFGEDARHGGENAIRERAEAGSRLLALDTSALGVAQTIGQPCSLVDQWLGADEIVAAQKLAEHWGRIWYHPRQPALSTNGIYWPRFDGEAMYYFWREVALFDALARCFTARGLSRVTTFRNQVFRPSLYYNPSDVGAATLKARLGRRFEGIQLPENTESRAYYSHLMCPAITFSDTDWISGNPPASVISDKVLLALNPGEFHRFLPVIGTLWHEVPGQIAVVSIFPKSFGENGSLECQGVHPLSPRIADHRVYPLGKQFAEGFVGLLDKGGDNFLRELIFTLRDHFAYHVQHRWPVLDATFRSWLDLFRRHRPKVVIVSTLADAESKLPAMAARHLNIPTMAIPHGGLWSIGECAPTDMVLYNSEPMKQIRRHYGTPTQRLIACQGIIGADEYPVNFEKKAMFSGAKRCNVLFVTNPVYYLTAFPAICPVQQLQALQTLQTMPADLEKRISWLIKPHPGRPDLELIREAGVDLGQKLAEPTEALSGLLTEADIVVALNYSASAVIESLRAGKPVVFFWNDPLIHGKMGPRQFSHLLLPAGTLVRTGEQLWWALERFCTEPTFADALKDRAATFARENLDTAAYPSLSDLIWEMAAVSKDGPTPMIHRPVTPPMESIFPGVTDLPVDMTGHISEYGGMPAEELQILCAVIRGCQPRTIFEIGTFKGGTTLRMAANSQARITTLDLPPKGHRDHRPPSMNDPDLDVYPDRPGIRFHGSPHALRIEQIFADSRTFDYSPYFGKMELVFVDACHHRDFVLRDSMNAFKMRAPGGMIIWHDYAEYAPGVMGALETVHKRFPLVHIVGTSLAVYMDDGNRAFRDHDHGVADNMALPNFPATGSQAGGESTDPFPVRLENPLGDQPRDMASVQTALLERISQSPGDVATLVDLALVAAADGNSKDALAFAADALILNPAEERAPSLKERLKKTPPSG